MRVAVLFASWIALAGQATLALWVGVLSSWGGVDGCGVMAWLPRSQGLAGLDGLPWAVGRHAHPVLDSVGVSVLGRSVAAGAVRGGG